MSKQLGEDYIAGFPTSVQKILGQIRALIKDLVPEAEETISYGIPTFKLNGNLVHYAAYKSHIGFYPGASGVEHFKDKCTGYKVSKGTIQFPLNQFPTP